jgi:hypothetical protein
MRESQMQNILDFDSPDQNLLHSTLLHDLIEDAPGIGMKELSNNIQLHY